MTTLNDKFETVLFNRYNRIKPISKPIDKTKCTYWDFQWFKQNLIRELGDKKIKFINSLSITHDWYDRFVLQQNVPYVCKIIPNAILFKHYYNIISKFMKKCIIIYKEKILQTKFIIARQKDQEDLICKIKYHPIHDTYFSSAFSGRFNGGIENGMLVIKCLKEGTTQEIVNLVCMYKIEPYIAKQKIFNVLSESSNDLEKFKKTVGYIMTLADKWFFQGISDIVSEFIQNYLNETLYKMNKTNSITRLQLFIQKSPILAEYIWETNFATENARKILGTALNISQKNMKAFIISNNIYELKNYLEKKEQTHKNPLDNLPPQIWTEITKCQKDLEIAKKGKRVGLKGIYISSDEIEAANTRLQMAWKKADQWVSKNQKK